MDSDNLFRGWIAKNSTEQILNNFRAGKTVVAFIIYVTLFEWRNGKGTCWRKIAAVAFL